MSHSVNFGKPFRVQTTQRDQQAVKKVGNVLIKLFELQLL